MEKLNNTLKPIAVVTSNKTFTKNDLIDVYDDTISYVLSHDFDESQIDNTMIWHNNPLTDDIKPTRGDLLSCGTINADCLYVAENEVKKGHKVCVLNMASFKRPGGGVLNGSRAQEEELFRRTNLFRYLYRYSPEHYNLASVDKCLEGYPLKMHDAIYTPNVTVFRNGPDKEYSFLDESFKIDVISSSAIKLHDSGGVNRLNDTQKEIMLYKIRQILNLCKLNHVDVPVLSAFGCGAYKNDPYEIAGLFKTVFDSKEFDGVFDDVIFAILDDHNSRKPHNPDGNLRPFTNIIVLNIK